MAIRMDSWVALLVAAFALVLLGGCETTGDPRQGGLFGWSESKAQERQASLQREVATAQGDAQNQQAAVARNQAQEAALTSQVTGLQARLNSLLAENTRLETQVKELLKKSGASTQELATIRSHLKENDALRHSVAQTDIHSQSVNARQVSQAINAQNARMNDDVLFLLSR
jgi:chromosome segregation ATPase